MPADVMQRLRPAVFIANNNNRIPIHIQGEEVPWLADFAGMPRKKPTFAPDALDIRLVNIRIAIKWLEKTVAGWLGRNQPLKARFGRVKIQPIHCRRYPSTSKRAKATGFHLRNAPWLR